MTIFIGILWSLLALVFLIAGIGNFDRAWDGAKENKFTTTVFFLGFSFLMFSVTTIIYRDHIKAAFGL